jgi:ArsR family transcriptional regulator
MKGGASPAEVAARVGANLGRYRRRSGLSLRRLAEATHLDYTRIYQLENGKAVPGPAVLIKLAACLNVRCDALVAGVRWDSAAGVFRLDEVAPEEDPLQRLAQNALAVRRRSGFSQEAVAATASVGRYDLSDFEAGRRAFRVFTLVRVAAALEEGLAELFTNVADWYVRPLPPPEYAPGDRPPTRAERAAEVIRLWRAGTPEREIAEVIEIPPTAIGPFIKELRDAGEDIPYRRRPRPRRRSEHDRRAASPAKGVSGEPKKAVPPLPAPTLDTVRAAELATMLKALADPHRLQIINMLAAAEESGSARVRDFKLLGIAERAVAYHLKKLADAGVVEREPLGRSNGFSLAPEALASVQDALSNRTVPTPASCEPDLALCED